MYWTDARDGAAETYQQEMARLRRSVALRGCPEQVHLRRRVWLLLLGLDPAGLSAVGDRSPADGARRVTLPAGGNKVGEGCGIEHADTPRTETEGDPDKAQLWLDVDRSLNHFELSIYGVCPQQPDILFANTFCPITNQ